MGWGQFGGCRTTLMALRDGLATPNKQNGVAETTSKSLESGSVTPV